MSDETRWRLLGTFTTTAPMHVGSGTVVEDPRLKNDKNEASCDVQAVAADFERRPCIPGTAVKGVLRAWAEQHFANDPAIDRVFGCDSDRANAEAGRAEFHTAIVVPPAPSQCQTFSAHVAYWPTEPQGERTAYTGIMSSVCINRVTGAAEQSKLFFEEFVPQGVAFAVEITLVRASAADMAFLLAVLEQGAAHPTHPYQFGASGADGWGRVTWALSGVFACHKKSKPTANAVGFDACTVTQPLPSRPAPTSRPPAHRQFTLTLTFAGPFLVNDTSRTHRDENDELPHFTPLTRANGSVWLPARSFRGVLRSRAEFLATSCGWPAARVKEVFGKTAAAARLTIDEFVEIGRCARRHQDFVAIDRFTGGAADGAKFHACYADQPTVRTTLTLDLANVSQGAEQLLALALRDVCRGEASFGFGGSKGYGVVKEATLCPAGAAWLQQHANADAPPDVATHALQRDVLEVEANKNPKAKPNRYLRSTRAKGEKAPWNELSKDIQASETVGAFDVEYETAAGKPIRIRYQGKPYLPPDPVAAKAPATARTSSTHFAHPYYFVRMEDRETFSGELADAAPATHARYEPDRYSGTLRVRLTTKTPLLLCDTSPGAATEGPPGHFTYPVLRGADGKPLLASSSVRGMLRSAYEAITNSRFGVFNSHDDRLGLRMASGEGLGLVPCRVHGGQIHLLPGTSSIANKGPNGPMYAAWLKIGTKLHGTTTEPVHRQEVCCWIELWSRTPWDKRQNRFRDDQRFEYWKVIAIAPHGASLAKPSPTKPCDKKPSTNHHTSLGQPLELVTDGFVCRTGYNFDHKHDERVFFTDPSVQQSPIPLTDAHRSAWANLIRDYRTNQDFANGRPRPGALRRAGWSRHMTDEADRELSDGSLAYARLDGTSVVRELFPVMISRKLYDLAPRDLLPAKLQPAAALTELSPADRVFGWVSQQSATADAGEPAHKSLIRVGPVTCITPAEQAIRTFETPLTLAILGQPKPAQGRFYLGKADGTAQTPGVSKEAAGYTRTPDEKRRNRIRGPKVYPHHPGGLDVNHWTGREQTSQNRSIDGWVNEQVTFEFELQLLNLSQVELGALLWLLELPADHYLRIGLGKPLGFGSVQAAIVPQGSCVADGSAWTKAAPTGERPVGADLSAAKAAFETTIAAANPLLLKAFMVSAAGLPQFAVHYPQIGSEAEHYKWFMANERTSRESAGRRLPLPDLTAPDPSLPRSPT